MKVHVYKVTELYVVDVDDCIEEICLQKALSAVKVGVVKSTKPECEFVAVVPGGQETCQ